MEKSLDRKGRWRNKLVGFRVSPEEAEVIDNFVRLSGLTKQDYIIRRLKSKGVPFPAGIDDGDSGGA